MKSIFLFVLFSFTLLFAEKVKCAEFFKHQWVSVNVGRTNDIFKKGNQDKKEFGLLYGIDVSCSIYKNGFVNFQRARACEFLSPLLQLHKPAESFKQSSVYVGCILTKKNFCYIMAVGYCRIKGVNRGKWLGVPGIETYDYESLPYTSKGFPWYFQINNNSDDWIGAGLRFSGTLQSEKDYFGVSLLLKLGR